MQYVPFVVICVCHMRFMLCDMWCNMWLLFQSQMEHLTTHAFYCLVVKACSVDEVDTCETLDPADLQC